MSQYSLSQVTCMCCGVDRAGMVFKPIDHIVHAERLRKDVNYRPRRDILGYFCENCGAYVCKGCRKNINYSNWSGWKNSQCKQCGQAFQGPRMLLPKEIGMYLNQLLEAEEEQDVVDLSEHESKDYSESDVERMKRANDVKGLEEVLKSETSKIMVIYAAMIALISIEEQLKDGVAIPSIIGLLDSSSVSIRALTARELSRIRWDSRVVDALILALDDTEYPVDLQASTWEMLEGKDKKPSPQAFAFESLAKIGDRKGLEAMTPKALGYGALLSGPTPTFFNKIGEPVVDFLIQGLSMEDVHCRIRAADALGLIGDSKAIVPLITTLNDENGAVRSQATWALGKLEDERVIEPLLQVLTDKYWVARSKAKEGINNIISKHNEPSRFTERFIHALSDEDSRVRAFAAEVLGKIGDKKANESLKLALRDENRKVRNTASKALKRIEKETAEGAPTQ